MVSVMAVFRSGATSVGGDLAVLDHLGPGDGFALDGGGEFVAAARHRRESVFVEGVAHVRRIEHLDQFGVPAVEDRLRRLARCDERVPVGGIETGENYLYSAALLILSIIWMTIGIRLGLAVLRLAGLALLTVVTLKVFLIDAAALEGVLRILSFMGLGIALIGIGWAYGKVMRAGSLAAE